MRPRASAALWTIAFAGVLVLHGCSDVGDSSAIPNSGISDDAAAAPEDAPGSTSDDASSGDDATGTDPESGAEDSTVVGSEGGASDANGEEMSLEDAGGGDAGPGDTGVADTGVDATIIDSGPADAGEVVDAGTDAGTHVDAGETIDAGVDAGHVVNALAPCTAAGDTSCVLCQYNNGAAGSLPNKTQLCTPTEAALVQHDIATGQATTAGADPDSSCYACAALAGCLDDSEFNDSDHECEDLSGSSSASECEATIACILGSSCGFASGALSTCYCGTAPVSGTCAAAGASNAANGACKTAEATGLGFAANDGLDILKNFTSTTLPAGAANNIFQCAASNTCTACLH